MVLLREAFKMEQSIEMTGAGQGNALRSTDHDLEVMAKIGKKQQFSVSFPFVWATPFRLTVVP